MSDSFGSNHPPVVSNERRLEFLQDLERIDRKIKQLGGEKGALIKAAKADGMAIDAARLSANLLKRDPDAVTDFLTEVIQNVGLRHVPVPDVSRIDLSVSPEASHRDQLALAEQWGYSAGKNGVAIEENPVEDQNSDLWRRWNDMHAIGQREAARIAGPGSEQAPATRARPGRKTNGAAAPAPAATNGHDEAELVANPEETGSLDEAPQKKRGGRPKGSKNKPREAPVAEEAEMPAF